MVFWKERFTIIKARQTKRSSDTQGMRKPVFIPKPKRKPRCDTDECRLCGVRHKFENLSCCWEDDTCMHASDQGIYCNNGPCFEEHIKRYHPDSQLINGMKK